MAAVTDRLVRGLLGVLLCGSVGASAASVKQAFSEGKHQGQIRVYNNTLALQHAPDKYGTAFGGKLGFETKAEHLWGLSLGVGYYTANDLETNKNNAVARAPFTPTVDVDILGEAFARWTGYDTVLTAGRQLVNSPHANPSDAFVVPITYTGYSVVNKSITGLTINAQYLMSIKTREAQKFVNVGDFILTRNAGVAKDTKGTSVFGLVYEHSPLKIQLWHYGFADFFNMQWLEADYGFDLGTYKPYLSAHLGLENDTGEKLLGNVDSKLVGVKAGVKAFGADLSFAYDKVSTGTFYSPYTYFTDGMYTNSMITGISNVDSGHAWKTMLLYDITTQWWAKLSHSRFKFDAGTDFSESDFDIRYLFSKEGDLDGLSALVRVGYRDGSNSPAGYADLIEYRTQLQYVF